MEQNLIYRGVPFAVKIEGRGYRWVIHSGGAGTVVGRTAGPSAFRQAVMQAHQAIDVWLAEKTADDFPAEHEMASG